MDIHYASARGLLEAAERLVEFDMDSIRQLAAAEDAPEPEVWLADPDGYQEADHVRRDSDSIRLIGYSRPPRILFATDGCNACRHVLDAPLERLSDEALDRLSRHTQLPTHLLQRLAQLIRRDASAPSIS